MTDKYRSYIYIYIYITILYLYIHTQPVTNDDNSKLNYLYIQRRLDISESSSFCLHWSIILEHTALTYNSGETADNYKTRIIKMNIWPAVERGSQLRTEKGRGGEGMRWRGSGEARSGDGEGKERSANYEVALT